MTCTNTTAANSQGYSRAGGDKANCLLPPAPLMAAPNGYIGVGECPTVIIALATVADSDPLLAGMFFAGVVECRRPVVEVAVIVQNAGEKKNWTVWATRDPLPVAGEGVVVQ